MSITFTTGNPTDKSGKPTPETDKKPDPKLMNLQKKKEQIEKQINRLTPVSDKLKKIALDIIAVGEEDPNDDPRELYNQVVDVLGRMGIKNFTVPQDTEITTYEQNGQRLYKIKIRRTAQIDTDMIDRIKRNERSFESIEWTPDGMVMSVWDKYEAPATPAR